MFACNIQSVLFYICVWVDFVDSISVCFFVHVGGKCEISIILPIIEFDHPEVTLCCSQDVIIELLTHWTPHFDAVKPPTKDR